MSPAQIRSLCDELGCTARELAATLGVEHKTVSGWLEGERFPTRGHVGRMEAVRKAGPDAVIRQKHRRREVTTMQRLGEPRFWEVIRKMLEHPALFEQVARLAAGYADPTSPEKANR